MNNLERLKLQEMIKTNNVEDQTQIIRELKHSVKIKKGLDRILELKKTIKASELRGICMQETPFLFNNYTDIFNKVVKDEIDIEMLERFISILSDIEEGRLDQHEGSYKVGKILKDIYIDSALKKSKNISNNDEKVAKKESISISWGEYKKLNS
tara:strand:+ start:402 stop:863 length:462 start_codon:yes stop_codon:yes gene_type:complete